MQRLTKKNTYQPHVCTPSWLAYIRQDFLGQDINSGDHTRIVVF